MENDPQMQLDLYNRMPVILEGTSSQLLSESHLRTTLFHPSNMDSRMIGIPIEQSYKDLHSDKNVIACDDLPNRYNFNPQDLCVPNYDVARESLRAMYSNTASYASSSSVPSSVSHDYDNLIGDINNRFLMHMEPVQFIEVQDANEWGLRSQNELCLSLATTGPSFPCPESIQEHCSDMGYSCIYERSSQRSQCNRELSLGRASSSQSAQFSELISGSRYRAVLQQILSDVSSFSLDSVDQNNYSRGSLLNSSSNVPFCSDQFGGDEFRETNGSIEAHAGNSRRKQDLESKKSQLLSLLQVVDEQYNRCLDQIHTVISAFHAASDLDPQLHASFALQSVTVFYKNLRQRISNQILEMGMDSSEVGGDNRTSSFEKCFIQKQWALQQSKKKDQQLWRPQRGLPERSVSVLRAWMFDNFLHPYPKDAEKHLLAVKSGLSRSQVSNWFINARVRLWKPLVEEMCSELNRRKGSRQIDEGSNNHYNQSNQLSIYDFNQILDA